MIRPSDSLVGTNLNSVWLEGTLVAEPEGVEPCRFSIQDSRPLDSEPPSVFVIEACRSVLDGCRSRLGAGQQVRIIGRLKQERHEVKVVSELVESLGT
jgi:single-stranded DNA-binding protein